MADVLTQRSSVSNLILTAYDKLVEFNLRSEPMFRRFASKKPSPDVTNPGSTIVLQLHNDLDRVTTPLSETADVDTVGMKNTAKVQVTLDEWGNALERTERAKLEVLSEIDPAIADMLSFNMMDSLDYQVYKVLTSLATGRSGTGTANETVVNGEDRTAETTSTLRAADIRKAVAKLRGAKVVPQEGKFFTALLHPDVSYDLRTEAVGSGANVWQQPHTYTEAGVGANWTGEIGVYEGAKFIESPRVEKIAGGARTITTVALTSNVATVTTSTNHGFDVGDVVVVDASNAVFDGEFTVASVPTATTFTYAKTNANVSSEANTGTVTAKEHKVLILGKQALVEAVSLEPKTVIGPVVDRLARFRTVGWKGLLGWNIYRPEARYVITVDSSI
jgi:N4-gp56 family major capsid protein